MSRIATDDALVLTAVLERIVPADEHPSASGFGADVYVLDRLAAGVDGTAEIVAGLRALARRAQQEHRRPFHRLGASEADALIGEVAGTPWFGALVRLTAEGVYADPGNGGNRDAASWEMIGYRHGLPEGPSGPEASAPRPPRRLPGPSDVLDYDVIVVGAGAGGGIAACVLAEAGKRVLLIERGRDHDYATSGHRDHLRNHRHARYGHNTGPELDGNPRIGIDIEGRDCVARPHEWAYHHNASGVGSGTVLYGGMAWRFHPEDFRMASRYGVPEGSSLADWPIGYDDLAPWYERAEWEIGVAGEGGTNRHEGARGRSYPMPPLPRRAAGRLLAHGAERLGLNTFSPPLLINSLPRDGRAACIGCGSCVGFPCPSEAKNGTHNTVIPRALATGRCHLVTGATATRIEHDPDGRITGVAFAQPDASGATRAFTARARAVVLSCGAIETARLLMLSGLGNDMVGRNLQGHTYPVAFGLFREEVNDSHGPGVTIATCDFVHGNEGVVGGAMLADDFVMPPIIFWEQALPPELPRWGGPAKDFMRRNFRHVTQVRGPVHEIPNPDCRVTLGPIRDRWGLPVARLSGTTHEETVRTARFVLAKAHDWLRAAGALGTWGAAPRRHMSAGQHQAGTCRMGTDPANSVTDTYGRVWGHDNLFVCDASLHPTNGGFNPVLTIMALAFRNAEHIAGSI